MTHTYSRQDKRSLKWPQIAYVHLIYTTCKIAEECAVKSDNFFEQLNEVKK